MKKIITLALCASLFSPVMFAKEPPSDAPHEKVVKKDRDGKEFQKDKEGKQPPKEHDGKKFSKDNKNTPPKQEDGKEHQKGKGGKEPPKEHDGKNPPPKPSDK